MPWFHVSGNVLCINNSDERKQEEAIKEENFRKACYNLSGYGGSWFSPCPLYYHHKKKKKKKKKIKREREREREKREKKDMVI